MTAEEFSNEFDTLIDSYKRFKNFDEKEVLDSIEFNEYEKSVFLTKALELIVKELYTGKNVFSDSFEKTEELRKSLEALVKQEDYMSEDSGETLIDNKYTHYIYDIPSDCWFIVFEQVLWGGTDSCANGRVADIIPVTHDNYIRIKNNPFKAPNIRKALRLTNSDYQVEIVTAYPIGTYTIRYISKPEPIIVAPLEETSISIDNKTDIQTCQLSDLIHRDILERAVKLALASISLTNTKDND